MKHERDGECIHCGLECDRRGSFCCSGCYLAHHLLAPHDGARVKASDRLLARIVVSALLAMGIMGFSLSLYGMEGQVSQESALALRGLFRLAALGLSLPVLLLLGVPLAEAVIHLRRRPSVDVLILSGVLAAWLVSVWNTLNEGASVYYETATMVLVLYTTGRWLDARTREQARERLELLALERERPAVRLHADEEVEVDPDQLQLGDRVRVRPGEAAPVDGLVLRGTAFVDTSDLSGEEQPRRMAPGDRVLAGMRSLDGCLDLRVDALPGTRVRDRIERLLQELGTGRSVLVQVADRVSAFFLPLVLTLTLGTLWAHWHSSGPEAALLNALSVLLIACPCALGLATPLAFWVALGEAWRAGILIHGGEVFERLARARRVFLDKTGTLTQREMQLVRTDPGEALSPTQALRLAAALEAESEHPIGRSLAAAWKEIDGGALPRVTEFRALSGIGVEGRVEGDLVRVTRSGKAHTDARPGETLVCLTRNGEEVAELALKTRLRPEARNVITRLTRLGLTPTVLTGDGPGPAAALSGELGVPVVAELLPADKVTYIRAESADGSVFLGDGLNDAPALAAADVGISMFQSSATSLESASVNLMRDDLTLLPRLFELSRQAVRTAKLNLVWAFSYNAVGLALAATGRLTPVFAASAMVASSVLVVLNTGRSRSKWRATDSGHARGADVALPHELRPETV